MLNAKELGARGDGKTDDTAALQHALDKAGESEAALYIPGGRYLCGELKVPPHIEMRGVAVFNYSESHGSVLCLNDPNARCLLNISQARATTLSGLNLEGGFLESPRPIHGILSEKDDYGSSEDSPRIDSCRVQQFTGDGIRLERIWVFAVRHTQCYSNRGSGLRIRGWDGFVLDNWFSGNCGAGIEAYDENAATTITANRIEWNWKHGIFIRGGEHYNITGNYLDRNGRCAIAIVGREHFLSRIITVTGNILYRSARPEWNSEDEYDNSHVRMENTVGLTFVGNTFKSGRDDEFNPQAPYSPAYCMVIKELECCIIKDNVFYKGCTKEFIVDLGNHGEQVVVKDNIGTLKKYQPPAV